MTEAYTTQAKILRYYGQVSNGVITQYGSHIPFNFELISDTNMDTPPSVFKQYITGWLGNMPKAAKVHANWVVCECFLQFR